MPQPSTPYRPYAEVHAKASGPGDALATALQVVKDLEAFGKLRHRNIVCTECSSGIGVETARAMYEAGADLYLTARGLDELETVIDEIIASSAVYKNAKDKPMRPKAISMHLDSLASVRDGVELIRQSVPSLYAIVNNAGVMACPYSTTMDGFEMQFGTNHLAHFLLFHELKHLLLKGASAGDPARLINVTSLAHILSPVLFDDISFSEGATYRKWASYGQSKTANIHFASQVSRLHRTEGLIGLSVHPEVIAADILRHMDQDDYAFLEEKDANVGMKSVEQGAATTDTKEGGRYLADVGETLEHAPYAYGQDSEERLWKVSNDMLGISA